MHPSFSDNQSSGNGLVAMVSNSGKKIESSLLPDEVEELDEWAKDLDATAKSLSVQYQNYGRAGAIRLAVRYALDHKNVLEEYLGKDY